MVLGGMPVPRADNGVRTGGGRPRPPRVLAPMPWSSVPPQTPVERSELAAELEGILADADGDTGLHYDRAVAVVAKALYGLSGAETARVVRGLVKLFRGTLPPEVVAVNTMNANGEARF